MSSRVRVGDYNNAPSARSFPKTVDHLAVAEYWGRESVACLYALQQGPSGMHAHLNEEHAYRCARLAGYHWTRARRYTSEMF